LDVPSGNYIKFSGTSENEIGIKQARPEQAKPRLAVALDYADIFLREKNDSIIGVFENFSSDSTDGGFTIKFSGEIKLNVEDVIAEIILVIYKRNGTQTVLHTKSIEITHAKNQLILTLNENKFDKHITDAIVRKSTSFVDITLKSGANYLSTYNTNKHWVFPIEFVDKQAQRIKELNKAITIASTSGAIIPPDFYENNKKDIMNKVHGYRMQRHSLYGEIPKFEFYMKAFKNEYA